MNSLCHRYLNQNILPFVGREAELARLYELFQSFLEEGETKYVLISGNLGSGKSRLVREFEERLGEHSNGDRARPSRAGGEGFRDAGLGASVDGCVIVHARYLEGNAAALTPIVNAFSATLSQQDHLKRLLGIWQKAKHEGGGESMDPTWTALTGIDRNAAFGTGGAVSSAPPLQVLIDSLSEIARRFPLVLILEDVHNIEDIPQIQLFDQFFLGLSHASKFVIFTERQRDESYSDEALEDESQTKDRSGLGTPSVPLQTSQRFSEQLLREIALREERVSELISLGNLRKEDVIRLFATLFAIVPSSTLLESVQKRTAGRPLLLRTMLRQLVSAGVLLYEEGVWSEDRSEPERAELETEVPAASEFVRFQRELDRLNPDEQLVVRYASVLGEQFDLRLLRNLLQLQSVRGGAAVSDSDYVADSVGAMPEEVFQRCIDLLTFKSIIRRATPSVLLYGGVGAGKNAAASDLGSWCYEFSHQHFWNSVQESAKDQLKGRHELVLAIASLAAREHLPLYSSSFLSVTGTTYALPKSERVQADVEFFLLWALEVVQSLWSVEPQQSLRFLLALTRIRDEITWRFGPELRERPMGALLDLHTLLVESFIRSGSLLDAERHLEHAAVLEKFIQSSAVYTSELRAIAAGKVATFRAILSASRTQYSQFERWSVHATEALSRVATTDLERARLLTILTRTRAELLLNTNRFKEADALIEAGMSTARLLSEARFDEFSLFFRVAVTSKLRQDENAQAVVLTEQIMSLAQQRGDTLVESTFLLQAALAAFNTGRMQNAVRYCDMGIVNGRRYGIRFVEIMCNLWRMIIAGVEQEIEKVKECSQNLVTLVEDARLAAQAPNLFQRVSLIEGRATAMNFLGRYHAALEYAQEAIQLASHHKHDSFAAWAMNEKALALVGLKEFDEARQLVESCLEIAGEQRTAARTARTILAMAYAGLGRVDDARAELERVAEEYTERNPYFLRYLAARARVLLAAIDASQSEVVKDRDERELREVIVDMLRLAEEWEAPLLHATLGRTFAAYAPKPKQTKAQRHPVPSDEPVTENRIAKVRLKTFGPLAVELLDRTAATEATGSRESRRDSKVRQLISLLIVARAEAGDSWSRKSITWLSTESILNALWPDADYSSGTTALYQAIRRARTFLGGNETIEYREGEYSLSSCVSLDCEDVLRHHKEARQARKREALFSIIFHDEQILRLTGRGEFLEGISGAWIDSLRVRLDSLRRSAAMQLVDANLERGLLDRVEDLCLDLLAADEFDEEAFRGLLIVAARRRQSSKLQSLYHDFSQKLKRELRSEPSQELRTLFEKLRETTDATSEV